MMRTPPSNRRARGSISAATAVRSLSLFAGATLGAGVGCSNHRSVPEQPTWAEVEPIVRGSCTQCHGGAAAVAGGSYRFDFYDMPDSVCGEAAAVLDGQTLARGLATLMGSDVTSPGSGWRARMPPAPTDPLTDWEQLTIQRWAKSPSRGLPPPGNHRPEIRVSSGSAIGDKSLSLSVVVTDPDDESVVGVLKIGEKTLYMDRPGAFTGTVDTSSWPSGIYPVSVVLCDGWDNVTYDLGNAQITHAPAPITMTDAAVVDGGGGAGGGAAPDAAADASPSDKPFAEASAAAHD